MKVEHFTAGSGQGIAKKIDAFLAERRREVIALSYASNYPAWPPKRDEASESHEEDYEGCERALLIYVEHD